MAEPVASEPRLFVGQARTKARAVPHQLLALQWKLVTDCAPWALLGAAGRLSAPAAPYRRLAEGVALPVPRRFPPCAGRRTSFRSSHPLAPSGICICSREPTGSPGAAQWCGLLDVLCRGPAHAV